MFARLQLLLLLLLLLRLLRLLRLLLLLLERAARQDGLGRRRGAGGHARVRARTRAGAGVHGVDDGVEDARVRVDTAGGPAHSRARDRGRGGRLRRPRRRQQSIRPRSCPVGHTSEGSLQWGSLANLRPPHEGYSRNP